MRRFGPPFSLGSTHCRQFSSLGPTICRPSSTLGHTVCAGPPLSRPISTLGFTLSLPSSIYWAATYVYACLHLHCALLYVDDPPLWALLQTGTSSVLCILYDGPSSTLCIIYTGPDRKSTRLNSSHSAKSRMPSSA